MRLTSAVLVASFAVTAAAEPCTVSVVPRFAPLTAGLVSVAYPDEAQPDLFRLVLLDRTRPIALAEPMPNGPPGVFRLSESAQARLRAAARPAAWLVPSAAAARPADWPAEVPLCATIEALNPAREAAWLDAGTRHGIRPGDTFWLRVPRQPAARLDVLLATEDLAFARITPLARDIEMDIGQTVSAWVATPDRPEGGARSAVAHVSRNAGEMVVWVAALPGIDTACEPHLDFYRAGRWLAHARVQRADDRFWYAGLISEAGQMPQVGDNVRVRTQAEIDGRRVTARVFELADKGAVIDAGERDRFVVGQSVMVYRSGEFLTRAEILHVQHTYAIVTPTARPGEPPVALAIGDEIHLTPPAPPPVPVGAVASLVDETLVTVRLTADAPLGTPLAIERDGEPAALIVLLAADGAAAAGYVVPRSSAAPIAPGLQVLRAARAPATP